MQKSKWKKHKNIVLPDEIFQKGKREEPKKELPEKRQRENSSEKKKKKKTRQKKGKTKERKEKRRKKTDEKKEKKKTQEKKEKKRKLKKGRQRKREEKKEKTSLFDQPEHPSPLPSPLKHPPPHPSSKNYGHNICGWYHHPFCPPSPSPPFPLQLNTPHQCVNRKRQLFKLVWKLPQLRSHQVEKRMKERKKREGGGTEEVGRRKLKRVKRREEEEGRKNKKKKTTNYQADKEHLFALSLSRKIKGSKSAAQPLFCFVLWKEREKREKKEREKERERLLYSVKVCVWVVEFKGSPLFLWFFWPFMVCFFLLFLLFFFLSPFLFFFCLFGFLSQPSSVVLWFFFFCLFKLFKLLFLHFFLFLNVFWWPPQKIILGGRMNTRKRKEREAGGRKKKGLLPFQKVIVRFNKNQFIQILKSKWVGDVPAPPLLFFCCLKLNCFVERNKNENFICDSTEWHKECIAFEAFQVNQLIKQRFIFERVSWCLHLHFGSQPSPSKLWEWMFTHSKHLPSTLTTVQ